MDKLCLGCRVRKPVDAFAKHHRRPDGLQPKCRLCCKAYADEWRARNVERKRQMDRDYAANNRERAKEKTREWVKKNPNRKKLNDHLYYEENKDKISEQSAAYRLENYDRIQERKRKYREENKERLRKDQRTWKQANKGKVLENVQFRKLKKKNATPIWLTKEDRRKMREMYETAQLYTEVLGEPFHVDHIVPISHPLVCGLHVPDNLQILPASENIEKSNKFKTDWCD